MKEMIAFGTGVYVGAFVAVVTMFFVKACIFAVLRAIAEKDEEK